MSNARMSDDQQVPQIGDDLVAPNASPLEEVIAADCGEVVMRCVRGLPDELRKPFVLRTSGGLSYAEIAGRLGKTTDIVRNSIHDARQKIRAALRDAGRIPPSPGK